MLPLNFLPSQPPQPAASSHATHENQGIPIEDHLHTRVTQTATSRLRNAPEFDEESPQLWQQFSSPSRSPLQDEIHLHWSQAERPSSPARRQPLSEDMEKVIRVLLETYPTYLNRERAITLVEHIHDLQNALDEGQKETILKAETFPFDIEVEKKAFHVVVDPNPIGKGGFKEVFKVDCFPTTRFETRGTIHTPSCKEKRALSVALNENVSFSPQARLLAAAVSPRAPVARFLSTAKPKDPNKGKAIATSLLYDGRIDGCDYSQSETPLLDFVKNIRTMLRGIEAFHKNGHVHRDVKAENTLARKNEDGTFDVVINDFDTVAREQKVPHRLMLTPDFAAPFIFGDTDDNLIIQKSRERRGIQSKGADLYSFARTLEMNLFPSFFYSMDRRYNIGDPFLDNVDEYNNTTRTVRGVHSDDQLRTIWRENRGRVIYYHENPDFDTLWIMEPYASRKQKMQDLMQFFNGLFSPAEYHALSNLINLTFFILENAEGMEVKQTLDEIERILEPLQNPAPSGLNPALKEATSSSKIDEPRAKKPRRLQYTV